MRASSRTRHFACCAAVVSFLYALAAPALAEMSWNALPPMATGRNVFTLTTLADGRWLVAGGWNGTEQSSCEIFNPATRTWSATGSLASTRVRHAAVRLADGRVLVAGGSSGSVGTKAVEIYDSATESWTPAAPRARTSSLVSLLLLDDGKVFLLGDLATVAEIYDPAMDTWTDTSSLGAWRNYTVATLLADGRVLVSGGLNSSSPPIEALVYDPAANSWTSTGPHVTPRWMHTASLLADGRVLVVGGRTTASPTVSLATAEVYDPASNSWMDAGAMGVSRINHTATLLSGGQLLVAGGQQYDGSSYLGAMTSAELYDPASGSFSPLPPLAQARSGHRASLLPTGEPVVVGGYAAGIFLSSAEVFSQAIADLGPPTVAITSPANGAALRGVVSLVAEASDDTGVVSVSFYAGSTLLGVDATAPYEYAWDTALTYGAQRTLKARARDLANKTTDSAPVSVTVVDTTPPTVALVSPAPGSTVADAFLLEADAFDLSGVSRVDFLVDGVVVATDDTQFFQAKLSASRFAPGAHSATALAVDYWNNEAYSGAVPFTVPVTVPASGMATFDPALRVPACGGGSECDSGDLLLGRGFVGPEPNAPNTLGATCPDSVGGGFHSDESLDRLRVRTVDGSALAPGQTVELSATVWAFSAGDFLDVYYAPDAEAPAWERVATVQAPGPGAHVLTASFALRAGGARQAVRGVFRYGLQPHPTEPACGGGPWDDNDDLAFSFGPGASGASGYDAYFQTPACLGFGPACDSGALLVGRGSIGPEPNQPNTTFGECPDDNWGALHVQRSVDKVRITSADSGPLRRYAPARVEVTVFASSEFANERLDLFEAADDGPYVYWRYLGSVTPLAPGLQVLSLDYMPTDGSLTRAIRAAYRAADTPQLSCSPHIFDDQDDLWFRIDGYPGSHALVVDGTSVDHATGGVDVRYGWGGGVAGSCRTGPGGPRSCELELPDSATVTLVALPDPGFAFAGWSGACSGTGPCALSMSEARRVGARFEKAPTPFRVVITGAAGATGVVDAYTDEPGLPPLRCQYAFGPQPSSCESSYPVGTLVHLYASAGPESVFVGWSGGCSGSAPYCSVVTTDGLVVEAQLDGPRRLTVMVDGANDASGTVDAWPHSGPWPPIHCVYAGGVPGTVACEGTYPVGTTVSLDAAPAPASVFVGWTGACSGPHPHCEVTLADALLVRAVFDGPRTLTVQVAGARGRVDAGPHTGPWPPIHCVHPGGGNGPVTCKGAYPLGSMVHLLATPEPGSLFAGWGGACAGSEPSCDVTMDAAALVTASFAAAAQPVVWTNRIGVTESGGVLTKTMIASWNNSGASSRQLLVEGAGLVTFTASETTTSRMLGLGEGGDASQSDKEIDFAIHLSSGGFVQVWERGVFRGGFGPYSSGDTFQVIVVPGVVPQVLYAKDGVVFYTSSIAPSYPLMVDCALYSQGATLAGVAVAGGWRTPERPAGQPVYWKNAEGVQVSGGSLTKTAPTRWGNAGASSQRWLRSGEGSVTFVATETNLQRMVGLSDIVDSNTSYTDLDYAVYLGPDARVRVYEKGASRGTFGAYAPGDWFQVAVVPGPTPQVRYARNGVVFYTSNVIPSYPLMVDCALYNTGATVTDAVVSGVWDDWVWE